MNKLKKYLLILKVIPKLGFKNVGYVIWYRLTLKSGLRKIFFKKGSCYKIEDFEYENKSSLKNSSNLKKDFNELKEGIFTFFSYHKHKLNNPPNWFYDPFNNYQYQDTDKHWCDINEFASHDIKIIWEQSRFQWLVILARYFRESNDSDAVKLGNEWVQNWINYNPLNIGPQWKCGQECSFRILHFILALRILSKKNILNPKDTIARFVYEHAIRIKKNIRYACAQDNNHGTSEALALFISGCLLENSNVKNHLQIASKLKKTGRKTLEERVKKLVLEDGSFSQRSVNYHRVLLDTLSMAEFFRQEFDQLEFNINFYKRCKSAIKWLHNFIANDETGEAPNFGHNDGAKILSLTSTSYQDYRESVNICSYFFNNYFLYDLHYNDEFLKALELSTVPNKTFERKSIHFKDGGYIIIRKNDIFCFLHVPKFKFRPSQNDLLHVDLWVAGKNILIDSGTYSYNSSLDFAVNEYHNTFQVKELSLPRIGQFIYGKWLNAYVKIFKDNEVEVTVKQGKLKYVEKLQVNENSIIISLDKYYDDLKSEEEFTFNCNCYDDLLKSTNSIVKCHKSKTSLHYLNLIDSYRGEIITEKGQVEIKF